MGKWKRGDNEDKWISGEMGQEKMDEKGKRANGEKGRRNISLSL
jgi:hypothetical protein